MQCTGSMIGDLSPRWVKAAVGPELEPTATLFLLCVCGGRSSIGKESSGREMCHKGKVVESYLLYKPSEQMAQWI